MEMSLLITQS